jgi:hypothetical protein
MDPTNAAMAGLQMFATLDSCIKLVVFTRVRLVGVPEWWSHRYGKDLVAKCKAYHQADKQIKGTNTNC